MNLNERQPNWEVSGEAARAEYYFVGLTLPAELSNRIATVQHGIYIRNQDRIIKPLQPHITMLPPPATCDTDWAELSNNPEALGSQAVPVRLTNIEEVEAYPDHYALVFTTDSPGAEALRKALFRKVRRQPSTRLHITLCQPTQGRVPPEIAEEYGQLLGGLVGTTFLSEGLAGFFDTGEYREYEPRPLG